MHLVFENTSISICFIFPTWSSLKSQWIRQTDFRAITCAIFKNYSLHAKCKSALTLEEFHQFGAHKQAHLLNMPERIYYMQSLFLTTPYVRTDHIQQMDVKKNNNKKIKRRKKEELIALSLDDLYPRRRLLNAWTPVRGSRRGKYGTQKNMNRAIALSAPIF